jgi:starch phosphorylase
MNKVLKDPVCRMVVQPDNGLTLSYAGDTVHFCSEYCQKKLRECPDRYLATFSGGPAMTRLRKTAHCYFSMEVALTRMTPTYAGGLGILAGDTLKSCADLRVPVVGVTLVSRKDISIRSWTKKPPAREASIRSAALKRPWT